MIKPQAQRVTFITTLVLVLSGAVSAASANDLTGFPRIIDGDTVSIDRTKVRLQVIDGPWWVEMGWPKHAAPESGRWAAGHFQEYLGPLRLP